MMKLKFKFLLVIGMISGLLSACYYDVESELYPEVNCDTASSYTAVIQPLVSSNCAKTGCHVSGAQNPDLSSYAGLKANAQRVRARATVEKTMPPTGPLNDCSAKALQSWIDQGAPNN